MIVEFCLNGKSVSLETAPDRRVVDVLREELGLTGTKECCGSGECGASYGESMPVKLMSSCCRAFL